MGSNFIGVRLRLYNSGSGSGSDEACLFWGLDSQRIGEPLFFSFLDIHFDVMLRFPCQHGI